MIELRGGRHYVRPVGVGQSCRCPQCNGSMVADRLDVVRYHPIPDGVTGRTLEANLAYERRLRMSMRGRMVAETIPRILFFCNGCSYATREVRA